MFQQQYVNAGQTVMGNFSVDFTVGRDTTIRLDYQNRNHIVSLTLDSPDNVVYKDLVFDDNAKAAYLKISDAKVYITFFRFYTCILI